MLGWVIAFALGVGLLAGAILLMPAVTAVVASLFSDEIAEIVERDPLSGRPAGPAAADPSSPRSKAPRSGSCRLSSISPPRRSCCSPGIGVVLFFLATAWLQGLQYFELAAMRFHPAAEAKALRRINQTTVFIAGLLIAAFVSIPILNLATPLFGTALMVHVYKRLAGANREAAAASSRPPSWMP